MTKRLSWASVCGLGAAGAAAVVIGCATALAATPEAAQKLVARHVLESLSQAVAAPATVAAPRSDWSRRAIVEQLDRLSRPHLVGPAAPAVAPAPVLPAVSLAPPAYEPPPPNRAAMIAPRPLPEFPAAPLVADDSHEAEPPRRAPIPAALAADEADEVVLAGGALETRVAPPGAGGNPLRPQGEPPAVLDPQRGNPLRP